MTYRALDDVWSDIVATLELGSGLRFAFIEAENRRAQGVLRKRLEDYLSTKGQALRTPAPKEDILDWLSLEQTQPGTSAPPEVVRWVVLPEVRPAKGPSERFVLHRLNEGRDNLRRNLGGVLFLVGTPGILQRMGNEAPDLWSVREMAMDLAAPASKSKRSMAVERAKQHPQIPYEVFLSFSRHDVDVARTLRKRLEEDGMHVHEVDERLVLADLMRHVDASDDLDPVDTELPPRRIFLIPLLSPQYLLMWGVVDELLRILVYMPSHFHAHVLPVMVRTTVLPWELRRLAYFDFRTPAKIEANYPRLLNAIK